jgi:hypothetical protein
MGQCINICWDPFSPGIVTKACMKMERFQRLEILTKHLIQQNASGLGWSSTIPSWSPFFVTLQVEVESVPLKIEPYLREDIFDDSEHTKLLEYNFEATLHQQNCERMIKIGVMA